MKGRKKHPVYDITKSGLISLTKSMAAGYVEYGIRVNAVLPGWTVTELHYNRSEDPGSRKKELEENTPLQI